MGKGLLQVTVSNYGCMGTRLLHVTVGSYGCIHKGLRQAVSHPIIVISLKEKMYSKADYLIGVYKDLGRGGSSGLVTVDLRGFPVETDVTTTTAAAMGG